MKAIIINSFETYENRADLVYDFLKDKGYTVKVVQSDFLHFKKEFRKDIKDDYIFVKSKPYYKNFSISRLFSHYYFSKNALKIIETINPDLLYVLIPPNALTKFASKYKKDKKKVKLVFDIIDMWPETMPVEKVKFLPPFLYWKHLRDNNLKYADLILTECNLYRKLLKDSLKEFKTETVYLAKKAINIEYKPELSMTTVNLVYLGSINHIIDIDKIVIIIKQIKEIKPVVLHIIGDGEKTKELISKVRESNTEVIFHGNIYNAQEKQQIFDVCHFGLNIMKSTVKVGLTMKSVDYFQHRLPIINNIPSDTEEIVNKYKVGLNVFSESNDLYSFFSDTDLNNKVLIMKENCVTVFQELFSINAFNQKFESLSL